MAFISAISLLSYSQQNDDKLNLYLSLGVKYVARDDFAGPLIGLSLDKKSSKFAYNYRSDMVFGVSGTFLPRTYQRTYQITDFTTFNYLDVDYKIYKKFRVTAGLGWVYGGWGSNNKFDETSGFVVSTLAIKYKVF